MPYKPLFSFKLPTSQKHTKSNTSWIITHNKDVSKTGLPTVAQPCKNSYCTFCSYRGKFGELWDSTTSSTFSSSSFASSIPYKLCIVFPPPWHQVPLLVNSETHGSVWNTRQYFIQRMGNLGFPTPKLKFPPQALLTSAIYLHTKYMQGLLCRLMTLFLYL